MKETTLVIVSGLPATGKTTLARRIGTEFKLPVFIKDDFKETIADSIGVKDSSVEGLGRASHSILFYIAKQCLENGISLVIEGNFKDTQHTREFIQYLKESRKRIIEILCTAEYSLRLERYKSRKKHPVHPLLTDPAYAKSFEEDKSFSLGIGKTLDIDTSDFSQIPYESIYDAIEDSL